MPKSIRPWVTAGIAVVGAGVIVVAPFEPLPPGDTIRITNSAVELDATPSPLDYYPQVVMRSLENVSDRLSEYLATPFPIVTAVVESQYNSLTDIVDAVEDGDVVSIVNAVIRAIAMPVANLVKVVGSGQPFEMAASLIVRLALPIVSGVIAAGSSVGDVVESLLDLDVVGALSTAANLPARILDGILNGRVDTVGEEYFGLLAPVTEAPVTDQLTGPVSFLITSLQDIGETISAPAPGSLGDDPADVPSLGAPTVTLPVEPEAASPTPSTDKPQPDNSDDPPAGPAEEPEPSEPGGQAPDPTDPTDPTDSTDPDPAESGNTPRISSEEAPAPASSEAPNAEAAPSDSPDDAGQDSSSGDTAADE